MSTKTQIVIVPYNQHQTLTSDNSAEITLVEVREDNGDRIMTNTNTYGLFSWGYRLGHLTYKKLRYVALLDIIFLRLEQIGMQQCT